MTPRLSQANDIASAAALTLKPYTTSDSIGVAGGSGTVQYTSTILGYLFDTSLTIGSTSDSGTMNVDSYSWGVPLTLDSGAGNINITATGGDLTFSHALNINTTTGDVNLTASGSIATNGGGVITTQGGSVTFDADTGGSGGYIKLNSGTSFTTNGGDITLGGDEANPANIVPGTGYATGKSGQADGILINNATVNAGGGNIVINGKGYNSTGNSNIGLFVNGASAAITTTGSGTITINTIGQGTGNSAADEGLYMDAGTISTVDGDLTIFGSAGGAGGTSWKSSSNSDPLPRPKRTHCG